MSKAIGLLESLGCNPALVQPSLAGYADAVTALGVDDRQKTALLNRDVPALSSLLGGRSKMAMSVATPDGGDESEEMPERQDDDQTETEEQSTEAGRSN